MPKQRQKKSKKKKQGVGEGSFNGVAKAKSNFKYFRYLLVEIFTFFWLRSQAFVACCLFFLLLLCNCAHQKKGGKVGELPKRRRWNGLRGQASCGAGEPETAGWLAALKVRLQGSILDIWNAKKHCILFHIQRNSMEAKKKTLHIIAGALAFRCSPEWQRMFLSRTGFVNQPTGRRGLLINHSILSSWNGNAGQSMLKKSLSCRGKTSDIIEICFNICEMLREICVLNAHVNWVEEASWQSSKDWRKSWLELF